MTLPKLLAAGLLLSVCLSKHIILLNEELLVLASFVCFLVFCSHTLSQTTQEAMDARSAATLGELQHHLQVRVCTLKDLHAYHTLCLHTQGRLTQVSTLVVDELSTMGAASGAVQARCIGQTKARADALVTQHAQVQTHLHEALRTSFRACAQA